MHTFDRRSAPWLLAGAIGWAGIAWIGVQLAGLSPPRAGDDLRLLVEAAARLASGGPLYAPPSAGSVMADSLFYSYPPLVAQALQPLAWVPFGLVVAAWGGCAALGLLAVTRQLERGRGSLLPVAWGVGPFIVPFAVALLFGNLNAWFPVAFGLLYVPFLRAGGGSRLAGGIALAVIAAAKLHPTSLGVWLAVRAVHGPDTSTARRVLGVAAATGLAILGLSLATGGIAPWLDYLNFLRSGAATANILSPLNIGPASQLGLLLGLGEAGARALQVVVTVVALAVTVLAAFRLGDPMESLAWAIAASLVVLPVTWIHYPVALIPVGLAALGRRDGAPNPSRIPVLLAGALVAGAMALVVPVAIWLGVACVLAAARMSRPAEDPAS